MSAYGRPHSEALEPSIFQPAGLQFRLHKTHQLISQSKEEHTKLKASYKSWTDDVERRRNEWKIFHTMKRAKKNAGRKPFKVDEAVTRRADKGWKSKIFAVEARVRSLWVVAECLRQEMARRASVVEADMEE
jgi:hypothetical protein